MFRRTPDFIEKNAYYGNWLLVKLYWSNDINTVQFYGPSVSGKLNESKKKKPEERRKKEKTSLANGSEMPTPMQHDLLK